MSIFNLKLRLLLRLFVLERSERVFWGKEVAMVILECIWSKLVHSCMFHSRLYHETGISRSVSALHTACRCATRLNYILLTLKCSHSHWLTHYLLPTVRSGVSPCRYNPLAEEGVKAVVDAVKYELPLTALKLGWCKVGNKAGAEHVGQLIAFNETLEVCIYLSSSCCHAYCNCCSHLI
jgi:hypothetical protein